jgi:hypothetical protein
MKKTMIDATDVTRTVLFRVDEGWYDAYWFGECPASRPRLLARVVRSLLAMIAAARAHYSGSPARHGASAMPPHRAKDLVAVREG